MDATDVATVEDMAGLRPLDLLGRRTLFTDARTANSFADTPISDAELSEIWELARWAPTASNMQPLRVVFVRPGEGRARLVTHMAAGNQLKTSSAPAVAVLALDTQFHEHLPIVFPFRPGLKDSFAANDELRRASGTFNAALQVGYFILAVRALGLAAGPMTGFDAAGLDADFFPDGRLHAITVVNIGHPDDSARRGRLPRLDHDNVVQWV